ncbi:glycyl-radical enzyme activating protein [Enterococcus rivorum]|uniref:Radical SAM protein n=1 Tax=Enterococcus rivorum TaxID=762845 RepID=A0A1E5L1M0_9ENTE|nr:glycyl-radical enzyme activating protein [Enterococcus rivorum]MBP2097778.1 pyruvate formate lyase activating enzyme [Enterococcus rivorum]OEH84040.1 radical SAM protein [Enterococcus rivorum]
MSIPVIFNIQKFSLHDGPGIRTTIFFKGCPLKCKWCHNPESINYNIESMLTKEGTHETVGKNYSISELVKEVEKDQLFYDQSGGGVTLSGGEVMTQDMDYIEQLVVSLHRKGISIIIDTSGMAPFKNFERILPYVDCFLYDLKFIDSQLHKKYTGSSNKVILENLKKLSDYGATIHLRLIQLDGLNNSTEVISTYIEWLKTNHIHVDEISLLPYHEFGSDKYARLGLTSEIFNKPTEDTLEKVKNQWLTYHSNISIGG